MSGGGLPMTPCPSVQLRGHYQKKGLFLSTHPRPLVLSSNLLCQPTPASQAAADEMPIVAHKGWVVAVRALPAKANPHTGLTFPWGSSGQLPLRFTTRALGEHKAPTNSWAIPTTEPPLGWRLCLLLRYTSRGTITALCDTSLGTFKSVSHLHSRETHSL